MRVLSAALVENPLLEHIKVTVFMNGLRVGPARTQLFRVHANTMEEAIQIALHEEYSHRQARTPVPAWQGNSAPGSAQAGSPGNGATSEPVSMELGLAEQRDIRCFGCGRLGAHEVCLPSQRTAEAVLREVLRLEGSRTAAATQEPGKCKTPVGAGRPTGEDLSLHDGRVRGTRHGGLAPESLGTLESRKSSD
ncbi:unnamed protein product [Phytophthora fragariaefolia]|uniref:Unnamed protein product n=1 Tax=Phytophthora fragariaefolia TaxID=1490495 RepID=A0A9W6YE19_9STRA|nr:unnamed protein product [Phytophthora fragariaefolia]